MGRTASVLLWLASLAAVGWWQNGAGHTAEREGWERRDNEALTKASQALHAAEEKARADELNHAAQLVAISKNYQEEKAREKKKTDDLIAAARSGAFRLRDPKAAGVPAVGSLACQTGPGASGRDARAPGELSAEAAGFLLGLTGEADDTARQLAACQAVVRKDRELCGGG